MQIVTVISVHCKRGGSSFPGFDDLSIVYLILPEGMVCEIQISPDHSLLAGGLGGAAPSRSRCWRCRVPLLALPPRRGWQRAGRAASAWAIAGRSYVSVVGAAWAITGRSYVSPASGPGMGSVGQSGRLGRICEVWLGAVFASGQPARAFGTGMGGPVVDALSNSSRVAIFTRSI